VQAFSILSVLSGSLGLAASLKISNIFDTWTPNQKNFFVFFAAFSDMLTFAVYVPSVGSLDDSPF
jgi:hypothetical protein